MPARYNFLLLEATRRLRDDFRAEKTDRPDLRIYPFIDLSI